MPRSKQKYIITEEVQVTEHRNWLLEAYSEDDAVTKFENFEVANIQFIGERRPITTDTNRTVYAKEL